MFELNVYNLFYLKQNQLGYFNIYRLFDVKSNVNERVLIIQTKMTNWEYLAYFLNVIYMTNISYMTIVIKMELETITKDQSLEKCKNTLIVLDIP